MLFSPGNGAWITNGTRFGRRSPANWTNRGWLSLDRNRRWLYLDPEGLYIRFSGICDVWSLTTPCSSVWVRLRRFVVCPRKTFTTLPLFEGDALLVSFCRGHYGDISIFFCLFVWSYLCVQDGVLCPCREYHWTKFTDTVVYKLYTVLSVSRRRLG